MHKYKYKNTNTNTQIQIHKYNCLALKFLLLTFIYIKNVFPQPRPESLTIMMIGVKGIGWIDDQDDDCHDGDNHDHHELRCERNWNDWWSSAENAAVFDFSDINSYEMGKFQKSSIPTMIWRVVGNGGDGDDDDGDDDAEKGGG